MLQPSLVTHGNRHGKLRKTVQEIGGTIQRVNNPLVFIAFLETAFLGEYAVTGKGLAQNINNFLLGLPVNFGDKIITVFCMDGKRIQFAEIADDDVTGATCCTYRNIKRGINGFSCLRILMRGIIPCPSRQE